MFRYVEKFEWFKSRVPNKRNQVKKKTTFRKFHHVSVSVITFSHLEKKSAILFAFLRQEH